MRGRGLRWPLLAWVVVALHEGAALAADPNGAHAPLPPPHDIGPRAPTPDWDVGLLAGVCGVGQAAVWEGTEFCGALLADVFWLRETRRRVGIGAYVLTGTAGFYDFRASTGLGLHLPLTQVLAGALRVGPLLQTMGDGVAPGISAQAELGIRALNQSGHYALTHALVVGWDQSFGEGSRVGSALTIALRVDAFWLAAPLGMLF